MLAEEGICRRYLLISQDQIHRKVDQCEALHWQAFLKQLWAGGGRDYLVDHHKICYDLPSLSTTETNMAKKNQLMVRQAAVLGAGVMGAQIAAHLTNAGVKTVLFDLPAKEVDSNAIVKAAIERLGKLSPSPIANEAVLSQIEPANYDQDLAKLQNCDLIIEAIGEKLEWKQALYTKVAASINDKAIFVTNTSGISIQQLAEVLPETLKSRFLGVHFFNPPRYMRLVEMIPTAQTDKTILPLLETFLTSTLGKGVVYAKDTPNFIANRVGVFSMLATLIHAEKFKIPLETVDALTGPAIGRPKSATCRTADVVGLDTLAHVVQTMTDYLKPNNLRMDPWHAQYQMPAWCGSLIKKGSLGQKTGVGIYQKQGKDILIFDLEKQAYRLADGKPSEAVQAILTIKDPKEKFAALQKSQHPEAQFLWACFRDVFHYAAYHLESIADNVREVDLALRWGFGWKQGIFETWQTAGWADITALIEADIASNKTLAKVALPAWVKKVEKVYDAQGAYAPKQQTQQPRSKLAVYQRQLFPDAVLAEKFNEGETIFENASFRLFHQGDDIAIATFKTKGNTVDEVVLASIVEAVDIAERDYKGLVLCQRNGADFSFGANLKMMLDLARHKGPEAIAELISNFQKAAMRLRYSEVPTVVALRGRALGGGCELSLHCDRIVAAFETYIGLVEIGVGLIPAGGGTKEFALRSVNCKTGQLDMNRLLEHFQMIARAGVSANAVDAKTKNFFKQADVVVFNPDEILYVAKQQASALYESGYHAPLLQKFPVAGKTGLTAIKAIIEKNAASGLLSEYDIYLSEHIAEVICGGAVAEGTLMDAKTLLTLERETFVEFMMQSKSQERIEFTLKTGKPLKN